MFVLCGFGPTTWGRLQEAAVPALSVLGVWKWSCCRGAHSGTWQITAQNPDGAFTGAFSGKTPTDVGEIRGRVQGERVEFTRKGTVNGQPFQQHWTGTLKENRMRGRLEHGEFSAELVPGSGNVTPAATARGGGICYDPKILTLMDEWLARAIPPQHPAEELRYDPWGRLIGKSHTGAVLEASLPPHTKLARCDWLWYHSATLRSTNGLGTLREYVDLKK